MHTVKYFLPYIFFIKIKILIKRATTATMRTLEQATVELQEIIQNVTGHPPVNVDSSASEAVSEEELPRGPLKIKRPAFLKKKYKPEDIKPDPTATPANRARKLFLLFFFFSNLHSRSLRLVSHRHRERQLRRFRPNSTWPPISALWTYAPRNGRRTIKKLSTDFLYFFNKIFTPGKIITCHLFKNDLRKIDENHKVSFCRLIIKSVWQKVWSTIRLMLHFCR